MSNSETDELLTWLHIECDKLKKDIRAVLERDEDYILPKLLEARLDAFRSILVFIQTDGKLR